MGQLNRPFNQRFGFIVSLKTGVYHAFCTVRYWIRRLTLQKAIDDRKRLFFSFMRKKLQCTHQIFIAGKSVFIVHGNPHFAQMNIY